MLCPICKRNAEQKYAPFCSLRCSQLDLYKWFNEEYTTPAIELDEIEIGELENTLEENPLEESTNHK
ncbi:DNA gyrase inhibitor YacG [Candidatus Hepatincolaceae symbiont of Richtersius coronifer]